MVGLWKEEFGRERQGIRVYGWMGHPGLRKKRDDEGQCAIMIIRTRTLALSLRRRQTLVNGAPSLSSPCTFPYYFLVHIHCSILRLLPLPILTDDHRYHIYVPIYYFTSVNSCFPDIPYPVCTFDSVHVLRGRQFIHAFFAHCPPLLQCPSSSTR